MNFGLCSTSSGQAYINFLSLVNLNMERRYGLVQEMAA